VKNNLLFHAEEAAEMKTWAKIDEKDSLVSDRMIRLQVYACLYANHIYRSVKICFNRILYKESQSLSPKRTSESNSESEKSDPNDDEWDWKGFSRLSWIVVIYERFGNTYMCYALIRALFQAGFIPNEIFPYIGVHFEKPIHCYLPGRLILIDDQYMNLIADILTASLHLMWRTVQHCNKKQILTACVFLLFSSKDLEKHSKMMTTRRKKMEKWSRRNQENAKIERFMTEILCLRFPISSSGKFIYITRPNRTRESNIGLRRVVATSMIMATIMFITGAVLVVTSFIIRSLYDRTFLIGYPGCDEKLNELKEKGLIDDYSINWSWWRTKMVLIDFIENFILWFDTAVSASGGLALSVILIYDLVVYWRHLHAHVLFLRQKLVENHEMRLASSFLIRSFPDSDVGCQNCLPIYTKSVHVFGSSCFGRKCSLIHQLNVDDSHRKSQAAADWSSDPIQLLKHQFHDLIREIKRVDIFISDTISLTLGIWLSILCSYVHVVQYLRLETNAGRNLILIVPMLVITLNYGLILILHRQCAKTYPILCSIMALDPSLQDKKSLLSVLEFFTDRRTSFRLFRQTPFLPSTYLTMVGWSFSCFFIISSISRRPY